MNSETNGSTSTGKLTLLGDRGFRIKNYDKSIGFDKNGLGDCVGSCVDTYLECCNKFGKENFSIGAYRGDLTKYNREESSFSDDKINKMLGRSRYLIHFYVINWKTDMIIDKSQGYNSYCDRGSYMVENYSLYKGITKENLIKNNSDTFHHYQFSYKRIQELFIDLEINRDTLYFLCCVLSQTKLDPYKYCKINWKNTFIDNTPEGY